MIQHLDCQDLAGKLAALPTDAFLSTIDNSATKISPLQYMVRLSYAACTKLGKSIGKEQAIKLVSDTSMVANMFSVLRPCPLQATDMSNNLRNWRKSRGITATRTLPEALQDRLPKQVDRW